MAYIVNANLEDKYADTQVEFTASTKPVLSFIEDHRKPPGALTGWLTGTFIPPELMPRHARIIRGQALYDYLTIRGGATLVSTRFRQCVEELDPGRHQFFPLDIVDQRGESLPDAYFVFNVVGSVDTIIAERSNFTALGKGKSRAWIYQRAYGPWKCALNKAELGDRACRTDVRYGRRWFFSDKLVARLKQERIEGIDYDLYCEETEL